ncbi:recombinase A [compost metagenome]
MKCKVVKNKVSPPFKVAEFDILFGRGINRMGCVLDVAVEHNIVQKSGAWFAFNDSKIGQGRDNTVAFLENNPAIGNEIETLVRRKLALIQQEQSGQLTEIAEEDLDEEFDEDEEA